MSLLLTDYNNRYKILLLKIVRENTTTTKGKKKIQPIEKYFTGRDCGQLQDAAPHEVAVFSTVTLCGRCIPPFLSGPVLLRDMCFLLRASLLITPTPPWQEAHQQDECSLCESPSSTTGFSRVLHTRKFVQGTLHLLTTSSTGALSSPAQNCFPNSQKLHRLCRQMWLEFMKHSWGFHQLQKESWCNDLKMTHF